MFRIIRPRKNFKTLYCVISTAVLMAIAMVPSVVHAVAPEGVHTIKAGDLSNYHEIRLGVLEESDMGIEIVLEGAFSGAGDTLPPMIVSIPGSIARLPLAYYFCFVLDIGINGVWWSLTITSLLKTIVLLFWFRQGKWKKKNI